MRLGNYPCVLVEDSLAYRAYGEAEVLERHRHRFELNNDYRERLEGAGMRASGLSPDRRLVEITEVEGHPFMLGVQFHPEFRSRPHRPHPLVSEFVGTAMRTLREGSQQSLPLGEEALTSDGLLGCRDGEVVRVAGRVVHRQRPLAAAVFLTLEDEHGLIPLAVWPAQWERLKGVLPRSVVVVEGQVSQRDDALNIAVQKAWPLALDLDYRHDRRDWR